jgi:hypothetical protein
VSEAHSALDFRRKRGAVGAVPTIRREWSQSLPQARPVWACLTSSLRHPYEVKSGQFDPDFLFLPGDAMPSCRIHLLILAGSISLDIK